MNKLFYIFKRKMFETLRQPVWIITCLINPILFLLLYAPLVGKFKTLNAETIEMFAPGMIVLFALMCCIAEGFTIIEEINSGVLERFCIAPCNRLLLILGPALRDIFIFIVTSLAFIIFCLCLGFRVNIFGLIILYLILMIFGTAITAFSIYLGLKMKTMAGVFSILFTLQLPILLLSGVLLPISASSPVWVYYLAHLDPLFYAVIASKSLCQGNFFNIYILVFLLIAIFLIIINFFICFMEYKKI